VLISMTSVYKLKIIYKSFPNYAVNGKKFTFLV